MTNMGAQQPAGATPATPPLRPLTSQEQEAAMGREPWLERVSPAGWKTRQAHPMELEDKGRAKRPT